MPEKNIKIFVDRINLATKKGLAGYFTPESICTEIHTESMNIWKKYVIDYEKSRKMDMYMRPFQFSEDVQLVNGIGTVITKDFVYYIEDATIVNNIENSTEIALINNDEWGYRKIHPIKIPTSKYPICNITNEKVEVLPKTITKIRINFIKLPTKPYYAYTISGDRKLYDDYNSIDFEWNDAVHDEIFNRVLGNLGIPLREYGIINQAERDRLKEGQ